MLLAERSVAIAPGSKERLNREVGVVTATDEVVDSGSLLSAVWLNSTLAPPLMQLGADGLIAAVNQAYCALMRTPCEDLLGRSPLEYTHPDDAEATRQFIARGPSMVRDGARLKKRYVLPDGQVISVLVNAIWSQESQRLCGYVTDITELVASQARSRALIEHSSDLIFIIDRSGRIAEANPATEELAGATTGRDAVSVLTELVHPDDLESVLSNWATVLASPGVHPVNTFRVADRAGRWKYVAVVANNQLFDPAVPGVVVNASDVTARISQIDQAVRNQEALVSAIFRIGEVRDPYTAGHQRQVADWSARIGRHLGLPDEELRDLRLGAALHDIGKIAIPSEILARPGRLSAPERQIVESHCQVGYDILRDTDLPDSVTDIVLHHHERLDGSGYPDGLTGNQISLGAQIVAVADVVDAMSSHRPYRPALGLSVALDELINHQGTLYHPDAVTAAAAIAQDPP